MPRLTTDRLELVPITLPMVEAVMQGDRIRAEAVAGASLPLAWPGEALIARAFGASLEAIRSDPTRRLWGDTLMIARDQPRVLGSVIFHGYPGDRVAEVGYGVEEESQGCGYATEATRACVAWALAQDGIDAVTATVFSWNRPSLRVIEKLGMQQCDAREHETLGELQVFILRRLGGA
jgi:RimJ/RimL family protein N-acetyltransferase